MQKLLKRAMSLMSMYLPITDTRRVRVILLSIIYAKDSFNLPSGDLILCQS